MDKDAAPLRQFMGPIADQIDTYPMDAMVDAPMGDDRGQLQLEAGAGATSTRAITCPSSIRRRSS
jgi:hypothetical protein